MTMTKKKSASKQKPNKAAMHTQQLLNLKRFVPLRSNDDTTCAIEGEDGMLYIYLMVQPVNISVLGRSEVLARIRYLQNVLENIPKMQFLCISSTQSYESNKRYYRQLAENARNRVLYNLCIQEMNYLDEINIVMNTSREFAVLLIGRADRMDDARHNTMQAVQLLREQHFNVRIADKEALKRLLAVHYVGDVYSEAIPEWDGQQYIGKEEQ